MSAVETPYSCRPTIGALRDVATAEAGDLHGTHGPSPRPAPGATGERQKWGSRHPQVEVAAINACSRLTKVARDDTS